MAMKVSRGPPSFEDRLYDIMWAYYAWEKEYARDKMEDFVKEYIYGETTKPSNPEATKSEGATDEPWHDWRWEGYDDSK